METRERKKEEKEELKKKVLRSNGINRLLILMAIFLALPMI
jgi:hypothetical protein